MIRRIALVICLFALLVTMSATPATANNEWTLMSEGIEVNGGVIPISMRTACGDGLDSDSEQCQMPTAKDVCISLTAYWPFDEQGNAIPWNGQADGSPNQTANGFHITADHKNTIAAAPLPLIGGRVKIMGLDAAINDTFGNVVYQHGVFWHDGYEHWVLPVDILSNDPIHYLVCDDFMIMTDDIVFDGSFDVIKSTTKQGANYETTGDINKKGYRIPDDLIEMVR